MDTRLEEINRQLEELAMQQCRREKLEATLGDLRAQCRERQSRESETARILEREEADVTRLEGVSLKGLLLSLTGGKDERLHQERREAAAARLQHDQAARDLLYIQGQLDRAEEEYRSLQEVPRRQRNLLEEKAALLMAQGSAAGHALTQVEAELNGVRAQRRELGEAVSAGRQARAALERVLGELDSAEGWGVWDMLGGGLVTTIIKHGHIDDAKSGLDEAQCALSRFRTELADVNITDCPQVEVGGFATFADYFFDGLLADWYVQSGIHDAQAGVSDTCHRVTEALARLERQDRSLEDRLRALEERRRELLKSN